MTTPRTEYVDNLLTNHSPEVAAEIMKLRIHHMDGANYQFYAVLRELAQINKTYVKELNKLVEYNVDLKASVHKHMVDNKKFKPEELENTSDIDFLVGVTDIWNTLMSQMKMELEYSLDFGLNLERQILPSLRDLTRDDVIHERHANLAHIADSIHLYQRNNRQAKLHEANALWDAEAPYSFELFESKDFRSISTLKDSVLKYQTTLGDYYQASSKGSDSITARYLELMPDEEIKKFAHSAAQGHISLDTVERKPTNSSSTIDPSRLRSKHGPGSNNDKRKSTFRSFVSNRFSSRSSNHGTDLMNSDFSDSANNTSLKKSPGKLKSKVGSIIGRNKRKSKSKVNMPDSISESDVSEKMSDTNRYRSRSNTNDTTNSNTHQGRGSQYYPRHRDTMNSQSSPSLYQDRAQTSTRRDSTLEKAKDVGTSPNRANISIDNPPLKPQLRPGYSNSSMPQGSFASPPGSNYTTPNATPSIPPSRKLTKSSYTFQPAPGMSTSNSLNSTIPAPSGAPDASRILTSNLTGELSPLNQQDTGNSVQLQGQALFQHTLEEGAQNKPGLIASIAEVIDSSFQNGVQTSSQLFGEIALNYNRNGTSQLPIGINLSIKNGEKLEKVVLNHAFVERVSPEQYKINPAFIESRSLGAIKYSYRDCVAPVVIHPVWKFEPHQASVVVALRLSSLLPTNISLLKIQNLVVSVSIDGALASSALSKPQGTFSAEKQRITWKIKEPVLLSTGNPEGLKLIGRFMTNGLAHEARNGVKVQFSIRGHENTNFNTNSTLGSNIALELQELDENNPFGSSWVALPAHTTLSTGKNYQSS